MRPHELVIPGASGVGSPRPDRSRRPSPLRLLAALALGLISPLLFSPIGLGPWWGQPVAALAVLLGAALVGEGLARAGRDGGAGGQGLRGPAAAGGAIGGVGIAFLALRHLAQAAGSPPGTGPAAAQWNILAAVLVPVLVGLTSALVAQHQPSAPLALGGAALGWLGAFIANVVAVLLGPTLNPAAQQNPEGVGTTLVIVVAVSVVGFAPALLGGLFGWGLGALAAGPSPSAPPHGASHSAGQDDQSL